ncbi:MAG: hypothetical protein E6G51_06360 [Actinobacteria bacterium]|nr:MAG: hypothetical protein E6G51_06360 [Actinomycetota bacterium]
MRTRVVTPVLLALVAVAALALLAGCGGDEEAEAAKGGGSVTVGATESRPLDLLLADCSHSFRHQSLQMVPEMIRVALDSADQQRELWAACFAGSPLRDLVWKPTIDFGDLTGPLARNPSLAERFNTARALGLKGEFEQIIRDTPRGTPGSGQLEVLELAGQTQGVGRVFLFTDARIFEPEGVPLGNASRAGVKQVVDHWAPRMRGLAGTELVFVGGGLGAASSPGARNARALFRQLAEQVEASFTWGRTLPPDF